MAAAGAWLSRYVAVEVSEPHGPAGHLPRPGKAPASVEYEVELRGGKIVVIDNRITVLTAPAPLFRSLLELLTGGSLRGMLDDWPMSQRRLKKRIDREGTLKEVRNHRHFEKPSEKRRRKMKIARFSAMLSARYADM